MYRGYSNGVMSKYLMNIIIENFTDNYVKCNILLIDWIVGIINLILVILLDTPEWSVKKYSIFIPRNEVLQFHLYEMTTAKQVSEILYINLNKSFE